MYNLTSHIKDLTIVFLQKQKLYQGIANTSNISDASKVNLIHDICNEKLDNLNQLSVKPYTKDRCIFFVYKLSAYIS